MLTLVLLASLAVPSVSAGPAATSAPIPATQPPSADAAGLAPTIHWEEAQAHAADVLDLAPGGRVTVGFEPRAGDRWMVGGELPRRLPAGRLSGRALRAAALEPDAVPAASATPSAVPNEATPTAIPTDDPAPASDPPAPQDPAPEPPTSPDPAGSTDPSIPPADRPIVDPADVIVAEPASFVAEPPAGDVSLAAPVTPAGLNKEVFGFLPYWELSDSSTTLDYSKISTIAYFGVGAAANGTLERTSASGATTVGWSGWTSARLTSVINTAHQNHTRVVLTVQSFAWSTSQATKQKALLGNSTARWTLARQIATAVRDRGADGVNLDFEPLASGYEDEFVHLLRRIRIELDAVAKGYQITFDTTGYIGNYPLEAATAADAADAIFVMGYDYRTAGSSPVGSIAPLNRSGYDITDTVNAYAARVSPSKLILGVPYYGRAWSTGSDKLHASNISGTKYGASTSVVYATGIEVLQQHGKRTDPTENVAWTAYRRENCTATYGCVNPWRQLYMDDAYTLRAKYDLVNRAGLRGVGIWALGYDNARPELWRALGDKFITDGLPFTDVTEFRAAIEWLFFQGITVGCSPTRFCPDARVTRVQMAQFLTRALKLATTTTDYFDDDDGITGESSINAAAKAGLTAGCGPRRYCPTRSVTRVQMAQFLARALKLPAATTDYFDDDDGITGESSINAIAKAGLTAGCGPRRYCP
ncbi:MAG: glycosyl hydrolase family 18 protein, partial [Chloroflexota bacterium]|nr:glycosyl hydrolase family 18 protein [Chloroflexota bacterium]